MRRIVQSSTPGVVERDTAVRLLAQRAVLTRMVCRELQECGENFFSKRPGAALGLLLQWVMDNCADHVDLEPHPGDGLDAMVVPDDCRELFQEIRDGVMACNGLWSLHTADNSLDVQDDEASIRRGLAAYWLKHDNPAPVPIVLAC